MRRLLTLVLVSVVLAAVVVPYLATASQMPVYMVKRLPAGTHVVEYAGQSLRFTSPIGIYAKFEPQTPTEFRLTVTVYEGFTGPSGALSQLDMEIHWIDWGSDVYTGAVPPSSAPFTGILYTESGFTEK